MLEWRLMILPVLLLASCDGKKTVAAPEAKQAPGASRSAAGGESEESPQSAPNLERNPQRPPVVKKHPVATPVEGKPGVVISPYSGAMVDVDGFQPGALAKDPKDGQVFTVPAADARPKPEPGTPLPGKPGFAVSPHTGNTVDVRDIPPGTVVADPSVAPIGSKRFTVPKTEE